MKSEYIIHRKGCESYLSVEDSAGGGILFGTAAVYAIKKAMKIAKDNPIDNLFFGDYDE